MTLRRPVMTVALLLAIFGGYLLGLVSGTHTANAEADKKDSEVKVKRVGMVIGLRPDKIEAYNKLHADDNPGVRDLLSKANMKNFSIFMQQLDNGKTYLFGYYEYVGEDFDKDMAWLDAQPRNKEWLEVTDPMQIPLRGQKGWKEMEQVYFNE